MMVMRSCTKPFLVSSTRFKKIMKRFSAFLLFLSLLILLGINLVDGRRSPAGGGEYWKSIMDNEPIPKAISDLLNRPGAESNSAAESDDDDKHYYIRNFDIRPNVILYHHHNHHHNNNNNDNVSDDDRQQEVHVDDADDDKHVKLKLLVSDPN